MRDRNIMKRREKSYTNDENDENVENRGPTAAASPPELKKPPQKPRARSRTADAGPSLLEGVDTSTLTRHLKCLLPPDRLRALSSEGDGDCASVADAPSRLRTRPYSTRPGDGVLITHGEADAAGLGGRGLKALGFALRNYGRPAGGGGSGGGRGPSWPTCGSPTAASSARTDTRTGTGTKTTRTSTAAVPGSRGAGAVRLGQPEPADTRPPGVPRQVRRPPVPGTGPGGGRRPPLAGGPVEPVRGARVPRPELERTVRVGPVGTPRRAAGVVRAVPRPVVEQPRGRRQPRDRRARGHPRAGRHEAPGRQGGGQRDRPAGCPVAPRVGPSQLDLAKIRPRREPLRDQGRVDGGPPPSVGHRLRHVDPPGHDRVEPHPEIPLGEHTVRTQRPLAVGTPGPRRQRRQRGAVRRRARPGGRDVPPRDDVAAVPRGEGTPHRPAEGTRPPLPGHVQPRRGGADTPVPSPAGPVLRRERARHRRAPRAVVHPRRAQPRRGIRDDDGEGRGVRERGRDGLRRRDVPVGRRGGRVQGEPRGDTAPGGGEREAEGEPGGDTAPGGGEREAEGEPGGDTAPGGGEREAEGEPGGDTAPGGGEREAEEGARGRVHPRRAQPRRGIRDDDGEGRGVRERGRDGLRRRDVPVGRRGGRVQGEPRGDTAPGGGEREAAQGEK
ncbi:hypothetical protein THAOC_04952 [Thalassiosira oceanica]|uniref:Uncharacterized protein n=1 Tax=Thalassiosira oceanica TaxID=159749 RepID=K0T6X9_THAOC|nr:hypothetical protein THAOC_04952 [Thalassiosira oceanica]|eukprot:EJK73425.1 hypothetical protein THAOC_04952 [Thalassiosira oceanica]